MQKIKKITAVFLALLMIISVAPLAGIDLAPKANALEMSGQLSDTISYTFDEATRTLTISGEGAMPDYKWDESPFSDDYYNYREINKIIIEDGITSIGNRAFEDRDKLTSITIPDSVTSIGDWAFSHCRNLTSIEIPVGVTSIGEGAFENCNSLADVYYNRTIEQWNAIDIEAYNDDLLKANIHCTDEMFCIISNESRSIHCAFNKKTGTLTISGTGNIDINNINNYYDSFLSVWQLFVDYSIKNVIIENGITGISDYAFSFYNSDIITSITIPDSVTSIGNYAFEYCTGLTSITIPDSVTSIGDYAFENCWGITSIEIPDSVTSIGIGVFSYCIKLASITVDENNSVYDSRDNCNAIIETATNTLIAGCKNTIIPDSVTCIGDYAFGCCYSLESITIPDSVTSIGSYAFYDCGLTSVEISDSVTSIGKCAFENCFSLRDVYVNWTDNIPEIDDEAFEHNDVFWTSATLHVPAGTKALYEAAENWKRFKNIVEETDTSIEEAREAALAELKAALKATDNDKVITAYSEAVKAVNAAQTAEAIEAAKTAGLEAMQVLRSEIISITELNTPYVAELVDLEIVVEKPVKKLLFTDRDGNTFTYTASSTRTISVVNNDDGTQTWTLQLTVRHSDDYYDVTVKERSSGSWSDKEYVYELKGYKRDRILSVEIPDVENGRLKYGTHDVVVTTGNEVSRVQVAYNGTTTTLSKSSSKATVVEDGENLVWTISFNFFKAAPETTYEFSSRSASGSWIKYEEPTVLEIYR